MPTRHVEPNSEALLQEIASSVSKARKVVVITGAGISTNSGIPDFRSENGLYSLIQAQFEADSLQKSTTDPDRERRRDNERPAKRARLSPDEDARDASSSNLSERASPSLDNATKHMLLGLDPGNDVNVTVDKGDVIPFEDEASSRPNMASSRRKSAMLSAPHTRPRSPVNTVLTRSQAKAWRASLDKVSDNDMDSDQANERHQSTIGNSAQARSFLEESISKVSSPRHPDLVQHCSSVQSNRLMCSSPLSSPPPILHNPYLNSTRPGSFALSIQASTSSRAPSEDPSPASTPPALWSPPSFASSSGRNSLPNMKGKDFFDAQIWTDPSKTEMFYRFATTLRQKVREVQPSTSHRFLSTLRDSMKLVRCYTQNIDQLEERAGLSTCLRLGTGNRYRFTVRTERNTGGRASLKAADSSLPATQFSGGDGSTEENGLLRLCKILSGETQGGSTNIPMRLKASDRQTNGDAGTKEREQKLTANQGNPMEVPAPTASHADGIISTGHATPSRPKTGPNRGVECVLLHGSLAQLRCFLCGRNSPWDNKEIEADTLAGQQPLCPHCVGATAARQERGKRALGIGKLRPDIVLYGEEHPDSHLIGPIVQHDLSLEPDMLLILGTSMRVHGLKVLVKQFAKAVHKRGGHVILINYTKPPDSVWADVIDYWIQWDCDAWVDDLQERKPALWLLPGAQVDEDEKKRPCRRRFPAARPETRQAAHVRVHKKNRAFMVTSILGNLRAMHGREPPTVSDFFPKPAPTDPALALTAPAKTTGLVQPTKKPREPVLKGPRGSDVDQPGDTTNWPVLTTKSSVPKTVPIPAAQKVAGSLDGSITATVKSRKRICRTWKLVNGVEKLVEDAGGGKKCDPLTWNHRPKGAVRRKDKAAAASCHLAPAARVEHDGPCNLPGLGGLNLPRPELSTRQRPPKLPTLRFQFDWHPGAKMQLFEPVEPAAPPGSNEALSPVSRARANRSSMHELNPFQFIDAKLHHLAWPPLWKMSTSSRADDEQVSFLTRAALVDAPRSLGEHLGPGLKHGAEPAAHLPHGPACAAYSYPSSNQMSIQAASSVGKPHRIYHQQSLRLNIDSNTHMTMPGLHRGLTGDEKYLREMEVAAALVRISSATGRIS